MKTELLSCFLPSASCLLHCPSMLSNQWHKCTRSVLFAFVSRFSFDHPHQALTLASFADWNYEPPTERELRNQRLRNYRSAGRDENCVIRRVRFPTQRPIERLDRRVVNTECANP